MRRLSVFMLLAFVGSGCAGHPPKVSSPHTDSTDVENASVPLETEAPHKILGDGWVEITERAQMITQGQETARAEALRQAYAEAVAVIAGIEVRSHTRDQQVEISVNGEIAKSFDAFSSLSSLQSNGRVDQEKMVREGIVTRAGQSYYELVVQLHVSMEKGQRDPTFMLSADLNQETFRDGEEMILTLRATKNSHVTVFNLLSDGTVELLYPNPAVPYDEVQANTPFEIPSEALRKRGLHLRKYADHDVPQNEALFVVACLTARQATRKRIPFPDAEITEDGVMPYQTTAFLAIQQWLLDIPLEDRVEETIQYVVIP